MACNPTEGRACLPHQTSTHAHARAHTHTRTHAHIAAAASSHSACHCRDRLRLRVWRVHARSWLPVPGCRRWLRGAERWARRNTWPWHRNHGLHVVRGVARMGRGGKARRDRTRGKFTRSTAKRARAREKERERERVCVCGCVCVRENENEKERETARQRGTGTHTHTHTHRERAKPTDGQTDRQRVGREALVRFALLYPQHSLNNKRPLVQLQGSVPRRGRQLHRGGVDLLSNSPDTQ